MNGGIPTDDLLRQFIQKGLQEMDGLRHDVQGLHQTIADMVGAIKLLVEKQTDGKANDEKHQIKIDEHESRLTRIETRMITFGAIYTGALVLMGVVIALLNLILKK